MAYEYGEYGLQHESCDVCENFTSLYESMELYDVVLRSGVDDTK